MIGTEKDTSKTLCDLYYKDKGGRLK